MSLKELESIINQLEQTKKSGGKCNSGITTGAGKKKRKSKISGGEVLDLSGSGIEGGVLDDISGNSQGGVVSGGKKRGRKKKAGILVGGSDGTPEDFSGSGLEAGRYAKNVKLGHVPSQLAPWINHVKLVRAKHPNMAYKEVLQLAKQSYR